MIALAFTIWNCCWIQISVCCTHYDAWIYSVGGVSTKSRSSRLIHYTIANTSWMSVSHTLTLSHSVCLYVCFSIILCTFCIIIESYNLACAYFVPLIQFSFDCDVHFSRFMSIYKYISWRWHNYAFIFFLNIHLDFVLHGNRSSFSNRIR